MLVSVTRKRGVNRALHWFKTVMIEILYCSNPFGLPYIKLR